MKRGCFFGWLLFLVAGFAAWGQEGGAGLGQPSPLSLDTALTPAALWETPPQAFVEDHKLLGFRWNSTAQDSAQTTLRGITLFEIPVPQAIVRVRNGAIRQATVYFYNRGDSGEITQKDFETLIRNVVAAFSRVTGVKLEDRGRDAASAVRAHGLAGESENASYLLEYSFTRASRGEPFRGEFVRLEISPKKEKGTLREEVAQEQEPAAPFRGRDHVVQDQATGQVVIKDIPMVDQGQKGYCVVASAERVLRYYGVRVDSHELAQLANSSAEEGTSVAAMTESLKKLTARLRVRTRTQIDFEYRDFIKLMESYNRQAKRADKSPVAAPGAVFDLKEVYAQMDPDVLRATRTRSKGELTRFMGLVKSNVDKGVPLLWSVMLGVIPEPMVPQSAGGHMRLIIGYNEKTEELLYSDSWGMGHELKKMPVADAWSITTGLSTLEPL